MAYKLGLVGLCTSHPAKWTRIIRDLNSDVDVDIVAAWDSGEVCPPNYADEFCRQNGIPHATTSLAEMSDLVDGVVIHSANWDRHVEQARPLIEAGCGVLLDKPMVGNVRDARAILQWAAEGQRITGGSSVRCAPEIRELCELPESDRGEFKTALGVCGVDRFFYGVHGFAMLCGLLGSGLQTVQAIDDRASGESEPGLLKLKWKTGQVGILLQAVPARLPLEFTAISDRGSFHRQIDTQHVYTEFLRRSLQYLTGKSPEPPAPLKVLLEPELAAIAALSSRANGGVEMPLDHDALFDFGYDGAQFAQNYRPRR